ncbi:CBS domain-containing protein [Pedobacter sp. SYP-B3415]|uniref:CBS domain-containing protein n=1 Tax=Pedobacter sp. SYP-B3415 TaxID=2496641 RepID=UPI0035133A19
MTSELITVTTSHSLEHCMTVMTEKHIRHLPVVEREELLGMVSIGDCVKWIIADQKQMISQLESYITS